MRRHITTEPFDPTPHRFDRWLTSNLLPRRPPKCCAWCGQRVAGRRRRWCSDACVHAFRVRAHAAYVRELVAERDRGRCAGCGQVGGTWEADHVIPVEQGGGCCDLDGFQTLCSQCHKRKTADHATQRARERQAAKRAANPQRQLFDSREKP